MRRLKIIFVYKLTICLLSWFLLVGELDALRGSAVVLQAKSKAEKKISDDEVVELDENGEQIVSNVTVASTKPTLTGIPQIDYVHDPNLPRELNGYNLTDYPFLNSVPEEIEFKCDGLHDGFYASVPHKCQLYHHCLFGTRFDFLCANYTAFDQKTFICHFVSQIDCNSSPKYFNRNEALYKAAETTTTSTTTVAPPPPPPPQRPPPQQQQQQQQYQPQYQQQPYEGRRVVAGGYAQGRKRRPPYRRRRPIYEYYYVDDEYDDQEYYDDPVEHIPMVKKPTRKSSRLNNYKPVDLESEYAESSSESDRPNNNEPVQQQQQQQHQHQQQRASSAVNTKNVSNQITSVYDKPRAPPKIRRPVPINERDRYDYTARAGGQQTAAAAPSTTTTSTTTTTTAEPPAKSKGKLPPPPTAVAAEPEYYDEDEEEYVEEETSGGKIESAANAKGARPDDYEETDRADKRRPSSSSPPPPAQPSQTPASSIRSKLLAKAPVAKSPPPPFAVSLRKKPAERVEEYEDEVPAATRQATTKRTTGAHAMRPKGPVVRSSAADEAVYHQPPRVSARHASRPRAQADHYKPTRMASRRPARPMYEYADEYYDE